MTQNGVISMGLAAGLVMLYTRGAVELLVVMYSINVFLTFTLSQAGMVRHWWNSRHSEEHWRRRFILATVGTLVTAFILGVTTVVRFRAGGWITLLVTGLFIAFCFVVRSHYRRVRRLLYSLDDVLTNLPLPEPDRVYRNVVFCSVGLVDSGQFKGVQDVKALEAKVRRDLEQYIQLAQRMGYYTEYRYTLGTDLIEELEKMCLDLVKEFRRPVVFAGQLVFQRENLFTRSLHRETAFSIQRRLQFAGVQVIILPIRVWERRNQPPGARARQVA